MTRWCLFLILVIAPNLGCAQRIVYYEPFDDMPGYSLTDWPYEFSGMVPWETGLPNLVGGCMLPIGGPMSIDVGTNKVACIPDCGPWNPNDSNVFSYTPHISLSGISGAWLKYDSYYEHYISGGDTEKATVEISIDSGRTWTVVQEVPANPSLSAFTTWYINLAAYNNIPDLRIGFRYNDGGGAMQGWAIDNVTVFVPALHDISLKFVTPTDTMLSYVQNGYGYVHHATVYNAGLDTIHSFVLNYVQGSGPVKTDTISGVALAPFSTTDFAHSMPDSIFSIGTFPVTMWAVLDSDSYLYNDTARTVVHGATFIPVKRLAIESGEGTWNGWSPRNMVDLASVPGHDVNACLISVHEADPMLDTPYHDFLYNLHWNYVPYILFDRRSKVPIDSFAAYLDLQKDYFGFASVAVAGAFDGASLTVTATVTPAIDLHGDFRLVLVVTENDVSGTGAGYAQVNNYAGGSLGIMGGYESLPNPVPAANMTYNYVARLISPSPDGVAGMLPADLLAGNSYTYDLSAAINPAWLAGRLAASVFLIRHDDSTILNSNQLPFYLKAPSPTIMAANAGVFPNPANDNAALFFDLCQDETVHIMVSDLSGRTIYQYPNCHFSQGRNTIPIPVSSLENGVYLINLKGHEWTKVVKLAVMH